MRFRTWFLLLLFALSLFGCTLQQQRLKLIEETLRGYHNAVQYKAPDKAATFVDPEKKKDFLQTAETMTKSQNVSEYEIRSVDFNVNDKDEVTVVVQRDYYDTASYEVRSVTLTQVWRNVDGSWKLMSGEW